MKLNRWVPIATASLLAAVFSIGDTYASGLPYGVQYAYDGQDLGAKAGYIQLNGTYPPTSQSGQFVSLSNTDGQGIHGGVKLYWENGSGQKEPVHYVYGKAFFPGTSATGTILNYALDQQTTNNGYVLVAQQNIPDWVSFLGGDTTYAQQNLNSLNAYSQIDAPGGSWTVADLVKVVDSCGATFSFAGDGGSNHYYVMDDGVTTEPAFKITPTPVPNGAISTDKSVYNVGDAVNISEQAQVFAANTNWHMEAVEITGPNGYDKFLPVNTGANGMGAAATGTAFPYWGPANGTLAEIYGGGSGDPSTPTTYNETSTLDTSGLAAGTYTVSYTLYDAVGRAANTGTNGTVTTSFTLQPSGAPTPNPTPPSSGGGSSSNTNMNLSIKFDSYNQPIPVGQASIPVTVSNNGNTDETTTLKFVRNGYKSTAVNVPPTYDSNGNMTSSGYMYYQLSPDTVTQTQTITVPAHGAKQYTISFFTGERLLGATNSGGIYDDPQYTFQMIASINDDRSIAETIYTDDIVQAWVPTTGIAIPGKPGAKLTE